jgi:hypothetical protein
MQRRRKPNAMQLQGRLVYFSAQNQHRLSRRENLPEDGKLQSHANLRLTPTALADSFF